MMSDTDSFPLVEVYGSHYQIGTQIGEQFCESIRESIHHLIQETRETKGLERDTIFHRASLYGSYIDKYAPHLAEEMSGIANGAGVTNEEAVLLQVRFEMAGWPGVASECTSGALSGACTKSGEVLLLQNQDTRKRYEGRGIILHIRPDRGREILMYTYMPGLMGYRGLNSSGLGCVGNGIVSRGWRVGFPRYLLIRLALEQATVEEAIEAIRRVDRGSTTNFLLASADGVVRDLEVTVEEDAVLVPHNDFFAHANHYLSEELVPEQLRLTADSPIRQERMHELLGAVARAGEVTVDDLKQILSDHYNYPKSICKHANDDPTDKLGEWKTVASFIFELDSRRMHVAAGNPCSNAYRTYTL